MGSYRRGCTPTSTPRGRDCGDSCDCARAAKGEWKVSLPASDGHLPGSDTAASQREASSACGVARGCAQPSCRLERAALENLPLADRAWEDDVDPEATRGDVQTRRRAYLRQRSVAFQRGKRQEPRRVALRVRRYAATARAIAVSLSRSGFVSARPSERYGLSAPTK
jgi:hypothetical protein